MNPFHGVAHLTFPVRDLAAAETFYVGVLGATLVRRMDRDAFLRLRPDRAVEADADNSPLHLAVRFGESPELHLFLQRALGDRAVAPHPHLALEVSAADLLVLRDRLVAAGVPVDGPRR